MARPVGSPNRSTAAVRLAIAQFAEASAPKLEAWLMEITDPAKRLELYLRALEYHIPKLAREEHVGADGGPVAHTYRWLDSEDDDKRAPAQHSAPLPAIEHDNTPEGKV